MNGAAMNCRQDPGVRPQHRDPSSLHNPGYHLQISRQQNLQPQNSKTLNYPSFSTNYQVDGYYDNLHRYENIADERHSFREVEDPRFQRPRAVHNRSKPIDLPVPQFEIDEHSVRDRYNSLIQGSKGLDLDTRIGLLIKSKALAGMHPIFSHLNDSEESESDLDDPFLSRPRSKFQDDSRDFPSVQREIPIRESFDDPEKPLSRPPSPFLSRATYLFWFNKAIEIKQQAKAQEQALLELATKRLMQDTSPLKINQVNRPQKKPILKTLMDQISKELKEVIKQEFIREVIEQTAFNTLDDWWEKQNQEETVIDESKNCIGSINENVQDSSINNSKFQGSTSPKTPFPWENDTKHQTNLSEENGMKLSCLGGEISVKKASRENCKNSFGSIHSLPRIKGKGMPLSNTGAEELTEQVEERNSVDQMGKCDRNNHKVSSLVKNCFEKIDNNFDNREQNGSVNLLNSVSPRLNTCNPEILPQRSEMSEISPSKVDTLDEKFVIVKDILEFIFNQVNEIVQRNDNIGQKVINENLVCKTYSNSVISIDSLRTENVKLDS